jgi:hypothetical protein
MVSGVVYRLDLSDRLVRLPAHAWIHFLAPELRPVYGAVSAHAHTVVAPVFVVEYLQAPAKAFARDVWRKNVDLGLHVG